MLCEVKVMRFSTSKYYAIFIYAMREILYNTVIQYSNIIQWGNCS